ncbi:DUF4345 domain-containing protein [Marivita sp. XM-24bin2]|jgi:hypothetical protein|uniref:DUF4345 domain-containing protein n=1 Tax=unclassified Marivita TaxID=2632480 RepID=UPI000D7956D4|nr:DUF4345 domain-containing protein [Marivita sp. XM-24bin2]MCR9109342.1 DUF4345 domain-containing protein [Paracoccaceae bacterium]PWL35482.1 MAG: DUF4345 domain-containing protein [Marivita sp. XM-24bin2]
MSSTRIEKVALAVSGLTAVGIGAFILAAPHACYAGYGIALSNDTSLLNELRAFSAGLAAFGMLMLAGIWLKALTPISIASALTVFIAFPVGRIIGLIVDGIPSSNLVAALVFELAVAGLCSVAFARRFKRSAHQTLSSQY